LPRHRIHAALGSEALARQAATTTDVNKKGLQMDHSTTSKAPEPDEEAEVPNYEVNLTPTPTRELKSEDREEMADQKNASIDGMAKPVGPPPLPPPLEEPEEPEDEKARQPRRQVILTRMTRLSMPA
jgi:hypothetical protein